MGLLARLCVWWGLAAGLLLGQRAAAQGFDPRGAVPPDSLIAAQDILPPQPDSLRRRFDQERLLTRLKVYARRKTLMGKALSAVFDFNRRDEERAGLDAELLDRQFDRHNFKVVRRINIRTYNAFGYSLGDSTRRPRTIIDKVGNSLHIKTARARIRQGLLFRPGDVLEPQDLSESERLLRQTPELLDARVLVNELTSTADSADIEVLTVDVFSLTGNLELGTATSGLVGLGEDNFLGRGHQISNSYRYGRDLPQSWAYSGSYTVPFRHFFFGRGYYNNEYNYRAGGVSLRRDFYSVTTRYAGAISVDAIDRNISPSVPVPGEPEVYQPLRYTQQDAWVGRALRLRSYDLGYESPGRLILSTRLLRTRYTARPEGSTVYRNGVQLLGTVGYTVRRYYKDRYLFGFGRTEDVPAGTLLSVTAGYDAATVPRRYLNTRLAAGTFNQNRGYLYASLELGAFQRLDNKEWEQGLLSTELTAFTRLYHVGNWQYRHYFSSRGTIGFRRGPDEILLGIQNERGLRGFSPGQPILATSRFVLNYENVLYTPLSLLGFRLAGLVFADAAWVSEQTGGGSPFRTAPYTGFGAGLRFRNEFTAIRTVQLLLGFYPRGLNTPNGLRLFETSRDAVTFSDFGLGAPGVGLYQ